MRSGWLRERYTGQVIDVAAIDVKGGPHVFAQTAGDRLVTARVPITTLRVDSS